MKEKHIYYDKIYLKRFVNTIFIMNRYKILFACNAYYPAIGGAEKVCKRMVEILSKEGEVTVLTQYNPDRKDKTRIVELASTTSYSYMPKLKEYLNTHDFDLYISFGYGKHFTDLIGSWTKRNKKPSIVMPCGFFHTNQHSPIKILYSTLMTKKALNNYTLRITATEWEKDFWHKKFGVTKHNTFVIPYNLEKDFGKFEKVKNISFLDERLKKKKYLLYIGRTGPNKLIELLLQAYYKSSQAIPLVIAGKGTEKYRDIFAQTKSDALKNIIFLGTVSEYGKKNLIENAKLCIFPSTYESFGMVLLESLALKTPTIGSNIGPFKEILKNDSLLFENNIDSLFKKISFAYENNYELAKINLPKQDIILRDIVSKLKNGIIPIKNISNSGIFKDERSQADEGVIVWVALLILVIVIGFAFFLDFFKALMKGIGQWMFK